MYTGPNIYYNVILGASDVVVTRFFKAALRAEHCHTTVAPLRGVPGFVRYYMVRYNTVPYLNVP
jgi:hypothetical protein